MARILANWCIIYSVNASWGSQNPSQSFGRISRLFQSYLSRVPQLISATSAQLRIGGEILNVRRSVFGVRALRNRINVARMGSLQQNFGQRMGKSSMWRTHAPPRAWRTAIVWLVAGKKLVPGRYSVADRWKSTRRSRLSRYVRPRSTESSGACLCSCCNVMKWSVPPVTQYASAARKLS
jgi:hypothetical protein